MSRQEPGAPGRAHASAIDSLLRAFEEQLESDQSPAIEDFLKVAPPAHRKELFVALLQRESARRAASGETFSAEEWKRRFPQYAANVDETLGIERPGSVGDTARLADEALERTANLSVPAVDDEDPERTAAVPSQRERTRAPGSSAEGGAKFGDYELLGEIARGGMGVVYKARQAKLNRIVAVKMILSGQLAAAEDVQRFYSEAEAAARLDHPGIVPIYEVGEVDGCHFFSMGFVDGASLQDEVARGPLPQRRAAELVRQIAEAVEYAHRHGIVHRDLKPRNILLASDGRPKVTDFGLAKQADSGVELTVSGQVLGTPAYMPPEQASGHLSQVGPRSDVYSLGGVLYCLLTGRPPFQSATLAETLKQVLESPAVAPRLLNPAIDRDLETICLKCLEKNPAHRYDSAQELADELGRYLAGEPIRARRLGPVTRTVRWIRRRPLAAALAGSIATLLIVIAVSGTAGAEFVARLRTSELERRIEERLAAPASTPEYLAQIDALLAELRPRNAAAAEAFDDRTHQAFAEAVRRDLRRPTLDADSIAAAENAIELLEPRDAELADELAKELERRRRDWQPVFRLASPFDEIAAVFPSTPRVSTIAPDAEGNVLRVEVPADEPFPRVLTNVSSEGVVRLQATFDAAWRDARIAGALLEADATTGYQFTLEGLPLPDEATAASLKREAMPLRERLALDGAIVAVIRRNGDPLVRRSIDAADLEEGPLTLTATCDRDTIRLQANALPPLTFVDPFPLRTRGVFGLVWPAGVGLLELQASRQPVPEATSPLEQGDEAFDRGEYASAYEQYELQSLESDDSAILQECRFKQGMCLVELSRFDEAAAAFEETLYQGDDRWAPLAGARLWALRLRQRRREEADGVFDYLSANYDFSRFAPLIPTQVRDEITAEYATNLYQVSETVRFDPDRIVEVQRAAAVDRYFSEDGRGDPMVQIDVARAFGLLGDLDAAVDAAAPVARDTRHSTVLRHYVRFLRLAGDAEGAKGELEAFLRRNPEAGNDSLLTIEKARIYAAIGDWPRCEAEVDEFYRRKRTGESVSPVLMSYAALIKGEILERRGAFEPAKAVRREAYLEAKPVVARQASSMTEVLHVMILGSLSEAMDDEDTRQLFSRLLRDGGDNAILRQAQAMIDPAALAKALREMWRSPLGRRYAEAFALESIPLRDRVRVPIALAGVEYVDQASMRGEMTLAQEQVVFETVGGAMDAMLHEGSIQMGQLVQLALTWKGQSGFIGWGAVAPTLSPGLRAGFAYIFAHRYIAMGKTEQAVEFLKTAEQDSPQGSELKRLAPLDRAALEKNEGFLSVRSQLAEPVKLVVTVDGSASPMEVLAEDGAEIAVPAGAATLALAADVDDVVLNRTNVQIAPAGRTTVEIRSAWAPAEASTVLRGLVPRPAPSAVGARWQIVFRHATQRPVDVAWSGDGSRFAVASEDGYIRIYPAGASEPSAALLAPQDLSMIRWAPSDDRILAAGRGFSHCGWDAASGVRLFYDRMKVDDSALSWRADARQFVSTESWGGRHLRIFDANGGLVAAPASARAGAKFAAISPDGTQAVARAWMNGYSDLHLHDVRAASPSNPGGAPRPQQAEPKVLTGPNESAYQSGGFSPDGRFFVAGSRTSELCLWKVDDWSRQRFSHEDHWVDRIAWTSDSKRIFVLSDNAPAMVFDVTDGAPALAGRVSTPGLFCGDLSPDGTTIVYADSDSRVHRAPVDGGAIESFGSESRSLLALAATSGEETLIAAAGAEGAVRLFDADGRQVRSIPTESWLALVAVAWSPDGASLAALGNDRRIYFWSREGERLGTFDVGARTYPPFLVWNRDGDAVYVVSESGVLTEVDPQAGVRELEQGDAIANVAAIAESRSGARAIARADGTVEIQTEASSPSASLKLADGRHARDLVWAPDAKRLAIVDDWGRVWLAATAAGTATRIGENSPGVASVAWSPDGARLATAPQNGRLQVWDSAAAELLGETASPSESELRSVAWLDDERIAVVGLDGVLRLARFAESGLAWDASTLLLPGGGWARVSSSGKLLDSQGDLDEALYVVETPQATLELLRHEEFLERVAAKFGSEAVDLRRNSPGETGDALTLPKADDELQVSPARLNELAKVADERIAEASGLARCSSRADAVWMHNDSGDPELFLVDFEGETVARLAVPAARCFDWEDCTTLRVDGVECLLVGDVGDNLRRRESLELFLIEEPDAAELENDDLEGNVLASLTLRFEDGSRDCEAIAYDSERGALLLLTKELERESGLYEAKLDFDSPGDATARRIASRSLPSVTAMDLSPDGSRLAVLTSSAVWEFDRPPAAEWDAVLSGAPRIYALPATGQFEALAYGADGRTIFVAGEGVGEKLLAIAPVDE